MKFEMEFSAIINALQSKRPLIIDSAGLTSLLENTELLREEDTSFSDKIRILKYQDWHIVQEKTKRGEFIARLLANRQDAEMLVDERLEIYEKMWNGCGCKINYYD